jgi:gluconolactonase
MPHASPTAELDRDSGGAFVAHAEEFAAVLGRDPRLVRVVATDAHEGPVYRAGEDALYFTTLPRAGRVVIKRLALDGDRFPLEPERVTVVAEPSGSPSVNMANGMAIDRDGSLLVCEQGTLSEPARISRLDPSTGSCETVVDEWRGLWLNSPNDVVAKRDGSVWFTDPSYGHLQGFRGEPQVGDYVYRYEPASGRLTVVADSFDKPNGLAFSPDERTLYVTDSGANQEPGSYHVRRPHHVVAFDVRDGHLVNQRLFAVVAPGFPDGLKVDAAGRVYASSSSGVQVFDAVGDLIGEIRLPGAVNCKMHELDNLYVVDSSFFVSSTAVNPTLTIIANSLRVADHLAERLGSPLPDVPATASA